MSKILILILIGLIAAGCTSGSIGNLEQVVQKRASFDFNCPEQYVQVLPMGITSFEAKGCGGSGKYQVSCSLGPCVAKKID